MTELLVGVKQWLMWRKEEGVTTVRLLVYCESGRTDSFLVSLLQNDRAQLMKVS